MCTLTLHMSCLAITITIVLLVTLKSKEILRYVISNKCTVFLNSQQLIIVLKLFFRERKKIKEEKYFPAKIIKT